MNARCQGHVGRRLHVLAFRMRRALLCDLAREGNGVGCSALGKERWIQQVISIGSAASHNYYVYHRRCIVDLPRNKQS
jgi:hypothetical protein